MRTSRPISRSSNLLYGGVCAVSLLVVGGLLFLGGGEGKAAERRGAKAEPRRLHADSAEGSSSSASPAPETSESDSTASVVANPTDDRDEFTPWLRSLGDRVASAFSRADLSALAGTAQTGPDESSEPLVPDPELPAWRAPRKAAPLSASGAEGIEFRFGWGLSEQVTIAKRVSVESPDRERRASTLQWRMRIEPRQGGGVNLLPEGYEWLFDQPDGIYWIAIVRAQVMNPLSHAWPPVGIDEVGRVEEVGDLYGLQRAAERLHARLFPGKLLPFDEYMRKAVASGAQEAVLGAVSRVCEQMHGRHCVLDEAGQARIPAELADSGDPLWEASGLEFTVTRDTDAPEGFVRVSLSYQLQCDAEQYYRRRILPLLGSSAEIGEKMALEERGRRRQQSFAFEFVTEPGSLRPLWFESTVSGGYVGEEPESRQEELMHFLWDEG